MNNMVNLSWQYISAQSFILNNFVIILGKKPNE
jgi:hypothetical protein